MCIWIRDVERAETYYTTPYPAILIDKGGLPIMTSMTHSDQIIDFMQIHFSLELFHPMRALARLTDIAERIIDGKRAAYSTHSLQ